MVRKNKENQSCREKINVDLLNLENDLEERAFIRDYSMFDDYSDSIFVTSKLKMLSGNLEEIHYDGNSIDTIFGPIINWQRTT